MQTLPNLGLIKWDNINDYFSHTQLAANFQLLDDHDHTSTKGKQIPAGGLGAASVDTAAIQDAAVTNAKIAASAGIPDSKLASPNNGAYKDVFSGKGSITTAATAGTYFLRDNTSQSATATVGTDFLVGGYLDTTDYTAGSLTQKLRLRVA
jgi:hypothetical protein